MLQGGDSGTKRVNVEQELDTRVACEVQSEENSLRAPEQLTASKSLETVSKTSKVHGRPDKSDYNELPKEMHEMKIKDDKADDHEDNAKVQC